MLASFAAPFRDNSFLDSEVKKCDCLRASAVLKVSILMLALRRLFVMWEGSKIIDFKYPSSFSFSVGFGSTLGFCLSMLQRAAGE